MKPSDFLPPATFFPMALTQHLRRAISEPFQAEDVRGGGRHAYAITVRDLEDGQLYRVTVEPEHVALEREAVDQAALDMLTGGAS